jgi:hypothetical protein
VLILRIQNLLIDSYQSPILNTRNKIYGAINHTDIQYHVIPTKNSDLSDSINTEKTAIIYKK